MLFCVFSYRNRRITLTRFSGLKTNPIMKNRLEFHNFLFSKKITQFKAYSLPFSGTFGKWSSNVSLFLGYFPKPPIKVSYFLHTKIHCYFCHFTYSPESLDPAFNNGYIFFLEIVQRFFFPSKQRNNTNSDPGQYLQIKFFFFNLKILKS